METWVLIVYLYVNQFRQSSSGSITSIPGFATNAECKQAGEVAKNLTSGEDANAHYVCVKQTSNKR